MRYALLLVSFILLIGIAGTTSAREGPQVKGQLLVPPTPIGCTTAQDFASWASWLFDSAPTVSTLAQVYAIGPGYVKVPVGAIATFKHSDIWYGREQPFEENLAWGFGAWSNAGTQTNLTANLVSSGGSAKDALPFAGKMIPFQFPTTNAVESGALIFNSQDTHQEWVYVYDVYTPENWPCQ
ncbi:MAG: hypothetical protein HY393_03750 [Candidatus Diapherotrites archaeon]|nr:hypothetical protein [Candidatus Diapherotrites archaeon]